MSSTIQHLHALGLPTSHGITRQPGVIRHKTQSHVDINVEATDPYADGWDAYQRGEQLDSALHTDAIARALYERGHQAAHADANPPPPRQRY